MKRLTALEHGFEHGQTILFAGQGVTRLTDARKGVFTQLSRRALIRFTDGTSVSVQNSAAFWAMAAFPDGETVLGRMVAEYAAMTDGRQRGTERTAGWGEALIFVCQQVHGHDRAQATEWVGDMIGELRGSRG